MGILLYIVARILQWVLTPIFYLYAICRLGSFKKIAQYFYKVAFATDQLGNVMGSVIMNDLMLKKSATYLYGDEDHTISHVTGVNYLENNLTWLGLLVAKILNTAEKDHVQKAAKNEQ